MKISPQRPQRSQRKTIVVLLCVLCVLCGEGFAQGPVAAAEKAIEAKDYATALKLLEEHVAKEPRDHRALFDIAYAYTMMGDRPQAIEGYRKALAIRPQLTQASMNLGILLLEANQPAEAARHFADVAAARPKDPRARNLLADALVASARAHIDQKQFAEAEAALAKALEVKPEDAAAQLERARMWELTGRHEDAQRFYAELAQKEPGNAPVRRRLGAMLLEQKKFADAAAEFEAAAAATPAPEDDWNLARAYAGAKQPDRAIPLLAKIVAADPRNYEARLLLGNMLLTKKDLPAAQRELQAAAGLRPDLPDAFVDLANVVYLQGNYPATLAVLDRVAALGKRTPWYYFLRAITLDKLDQVQPALDNYEQFLATAKGDFPDQEFQARQRARILNARLEKSGKRRRR